MCCKSSKNYFGQLIWLNTVLGFCCLIILRVSSSRWHMQNFSIFTSWGILDHWLYFDGYCKVTCNSQDTPLGLCWKLSENMFWQLKRLNTGLDSNWLYLIFTHVSHFMYFHGYCKVTSYSQYTFHWLCVVNHQKLFRPINLDECCAWILLVDYITSELF